MGIRRSIPDSLREYGRGIAGGLLFSLPLLYTMEVWHAGFTIPPHRQLAYLAGTFVLLLGYNRYSGLHPSSGWAEVVVDSVEELGIGLVLSAAILLALGRIGPGQNLDEVAGRIIVEAFTIAIGVSVGTAQLGGDPERGNEAREVGLGGQLALSGCGAVLFAANVAPTEEILMIAVESGVWRVVGLAILSILLVGGVLHWVDFKGAERYARAETTLDVITGTAITYAVALTASAVLLWFFGRFDDTGAAVCASQVIVLGLPAALGAAAGRLLLQS